MEGKCAYVYFLVILTASNRVVAGSHNFVGAGRYETGNNKSSSDQEEKESSPITTIPNITTQSYSSSSISPTHNTTEQPTSTKGTTTEIPTFTTEETIGTTSGTKQTEEPTTQHDHTGSTTHELPSSHSTTDMTSSHKPPTSPVTSLKPFVTSEQSPTIRSSKIPVVTTTHKALRGPTKLDAGSFIGGMVIGIVLFGVSYGAYVYIQNKKRGQNKYSRVN